MIRNVVNDRAEKSARGATIVNIPAPESFIANQLYSNDCKMILTRCFWIVGWGITVQYSKY